MVGNGYLNTIKDFCSGNQIGYINLFVGEYGGIESKGVYKTEEQAKSAIAVHDNNSFIKTIKINY